MCKNNKTRHNGYGNILAMCKTSTTGHDDMLCCGNGQAVCKNCTRRHDEILWVSTSDLALVGITYVVL